MKVFNIILLLIPLFFLGRILFTVLFTAKKFRKNTKKLNEWSEFNRRLLAWGDEIKDKTVKQEYLQFCIDKVLGIKNLDIDNITQMSLIDLKQEVITKYIDHIPSLKQEVRDQKINKILH